VDFRTRVFRRRSIENWLPPPDRPPKADTCGARFNDRYRFSYLTALPPPPTAMYTHHPIRVYPNDRPNTLSYPNIVTPLSPARELGLTRDVHFYTLPFRVHCPDPQGHRAVGIRITRRLYVSFRSRFASAVRTYGFLPLFYRRRSDNSVIGGTFSSNGFDVNALPVQIVNVQIPKRSSAGIDLLSNRRFIGLRPSAIRSPSTTKRSLNVPPVPRDR